MTTLSSPVASRAIALSVSAIFLFGLFWRKTTTNAALSAVFLAIPISLGLKAFAGDLAFLHRMGISFVLISLLIIVISMGEGGGKDADKAIDAPAELFDTGTVFNLTSVIVIGLLAVIYGRFW